MSERVILAAGGLEAHVLPAAGGSIARFDRMVAAGRDPLLRGTDRVDAHALDCGCFPLVPFCNRIRGGTFDHQGRTIHLAPNMPPDPSPLHGQGWLAQWQPRARSDSSLDLQFRHEADEWPWTYEARQLIRLDPGGMTIELSCRNLSSRVMPCGLGLHPYFPCSWGSRLDTGVEGVFTVDENVLPVERVAANGRYDLRDRPICGQDLDNGFDGWSGAATIHQRAGGTSLRMISSDASYFQVWSPFPGRVFAAEPVQHANCALNAPASDWERLGLVVLRRGETRTLHVRFEIVPQPSAAT